MISSLEQKIRVIKALLFESSSRIEQGFLQKRILRLCPVFLISLMFVGCTPSAKQYNILALGDSNGASETGWVVQLQELRPDDTILNYSVSGNTVGFDNLDQERLNTLKKIDYYLETALDSIETIDAVVVLLGTNDAKAVFKDRQGEVVENMSELIKMIRRKTVAHGVKIPEIIINSPPPYGPDSVLADKYIGGDDRVAWLKTEYQKLGNSLGIHFVDQYDVLKKNFSAYSNDGVHLTEEGQLMMAKQMDSVLTVININQ